MKILYLCADPGIPIRGHKGAAIHVRALIEAFAGLGHEITLITPHPGPADGTEPAARLIEVHNQAVPAESAPADAEQAAHATASAVQQSARMLIQSERFDLIYERYSLWSAAGARLAAETGLPYIVEVNAPLRYEASRYRTLVDGTLAEEIEAEVIRTATAVVAVSEPLRKYLIDRGAPPDRLHVIANGVDDRIFHPGVDGTEWRRQLGLDDKFIIGFAGTSRPWHDLNGLLDAVSMLAANHARMPVLRDRRPAPYHLLLVGTISSGVRSRIQELGLTESVTVLDAVPHAAIPSLLASMDVAVSPHPALSDFYFSPLKLFEYMACGRATVAADLPTIAAVVQDGVHALLYAPGNAADLARRIAELAANSSRREALGMAAAQHVLSHHTWMRNAREILRLVPASNRSGTPPAPERPPLWDERLGRAAYRATRLDLASAAFSRHRLTAPFLPLTNWRVLKYRLGRRCVIAYETAGGSRGESPRGIVGKVFRDDRAEAHLKLQEELWAAGFSAGSPDHIAVAQPLAHIREMNMFAQAWAPGTTLDQHVDAPDLDARVRLAAAAIAKLHAAPLVHLSAYDLETELSNLEQWGTELSRLRPELASTFGQHLDSLHREALALPPAQPSPIHRDFYYSQLLFHNGGVTLIDLDLLAYGDPALDVGNFAAHLRFLGMQHPTAARKLDAARRAFLQEYLRRRPSMPGAEARLQFYERATLFRLLYVAATRPRYSDYFNNLLESLNVQLQLQMENSA